MNNITTSESLNEIGKKILHWLGENIAILIGVILIIIVAMIANKVLGGIMSKVLGKTIREDMFPTKTDRDRRLRTLNSIASAIISFMVWSVAFIMILNKIGINTAPLLASAGIIGIALGFGTQSLVKDFMSGMFIIAENQYRVGDHVEIQNVKGVVKSITMRTTVLQDDEGSVFHIPNGSIIVTGNHTMNNSQLSFELSASTETNIEKLQVCVDKVGKAIATQKALKDYVIEPLHFERVKDIKGGVIVVKVSGKVKAGKQIVVKSAYFEALQEELIKNKIALK